MNGKGHADSQHRTAMKEWSCSEGACKRNKKVAQRKTITSKEMPWQLLVKRNMFIKGNQRMENTFHQPTEVKVWNDGYRALSHSLCAPHKPVRVEHSSSTTVRLRQKTNLPAWFGESAARKIRLEGASRNFIYNLFWAFIPLWDECKWHIIYSAY